ncbi:MAG: hypothetical protein ACOY4T_06485 [Pseudomonadota bacterium]|jgi:hypothetical protein
MTSLLEKARIGRTNALSILPNGSFGRAAGARHRSSDRHEKVTFISSRARLAAATILA